MVEQEALNYRQAFCEFYRRSVELTQKRLDARGLLIERPYAEAPKEKQVDTAPGGPNRKLTITILKKFLGPLNDDEQDMSMERQSDKKQKSKSLP